MLTYYTEGIREIQPWLTLKDFTWKIGPIGFNPETGIPYCDIVLWEKYKQYEERIEFEAPAEYNQSNLIAKCIEKILQLPAFQNSVPA